MVRRPHWSYSQVNQFLRCPLQYFFDRIAKVPKAFTASGLVLGGAVHEALAAYHIGLQTGRPINKEQLTDAFLAGWQKRHAEGPVQFGKGETISELVDQGVALLEAYAEEPPPERIKAVEKELLVPLHTSQGEILEKPLVAILDLLCEEGGQLTVVEFKTSSRKYGPAEVDRSLQSVAYRHACEEKYERRTRVRYTVLVKTKTPTVQHLDATESEGDFARLGDLVQTVERAIEAGAFYPIENAMNCSGCPFRKPCREWQGTQLPILSKSEPCQACRTVVC